MCEVVFIKDNGERTLEVNGIEVNIRIEDES